MWTLGCCSLSCHSIDLNAGSRSMAGNLSVIVVAVVGAKDLSSGTSNDNHRCATKTNFY